MYLYYRYPCKGSLYWHSQDPTGSHTDLPTVMPTSAPLEDCVASAVSGWTNTTLLICTCGPTGSQTSFPIASPSGDIGLLLRPFPLQVFLQKLFFSSLESLHVRSFFLFLTNHPAPYASLESWTHFVLWQRYTHSFGYVLLLLLTYVIQSEWNHFVLYPYPQQLWVKPNQLSTHTFSIK